MEERTNEIRPYAHSALRSSDKYIVLAKREGERSIHSMSNTCVTRNIVSYRLELEIYYVKYIKQYEQIITEHNVSLLITSTISPNVASIRLISIQNTNLFRKRSYFPNTRFGNDD